MAEPLGFDHYRDHYTTEDLWDMLITQGDPTSVELSSTVWATARGKLSNARETLNTNVSDLTDHWQGPASEEFQNRMILVIQYSEATEFLMEQAETDHLPGIAGHLAAAQARARGENHLGEDLDPANDILDLEEWMEQVKGLDRAEIASLTSSGWTANTNEHNAWREARHDELAQTVADLGVRYAYYANTIFAEPPPPRPDGMPGNPTFERPSSGVFADHPTDTAINTPADTVQQPDTSTNTETTSLVLDDDEDDEASPWAYSSYDDLDDPSGGLASSGTATTTLPSSGSYIGGTAPGSNIPSTGPNSGTGAAPGGGMNPAAPMRGTAPPSGRNSTAGRSGINPNLHTRPGTTGPGSGNTPTGGRRNTSETEEEETETRASKYIEAEDFFTAPFDPAAGPAHEGPKHQRAWDKEHAAWEEHQRDQEP